MVLWNSIITLKEDVSTFYAEELQLPALPLEVSYASKTAVLEPLPIVSIALTLASLASPESPEIVPSSPRAPFAVRPFMA